MDKVTKTHYIIEGKQYDRVTAVLDYFITADLMKWYQRVGMREAKARQKSAKTIGTRVHNLIHQHHQKGYWKLTPHDTVSIRNCIEAYKRWYATEKPEIWNMEARCQSDKYMVAGTIDMVTRDTMIDIKTSERIYPHYWLQVAMYEHMKSYGMRSPTLGILRLDKFTGEYEYKKIRQCWGLIRCYLGVLDYYRFLTKGGIDDPKFAC